MHKSLIYASDYRAANERWGRVSIVLEHWGSGSDYALRRLGAARRLLGVHRHGEFVDESRLVGVKIFNAPHSLPGMR